MKTNYKTRIFIHVKEEYIYNRKYKEKSLLLITVRGALSIDVSVHVTALGSVALKLITNLENPSSNPLQRP